MVGCSLLETERRFEGGSSGGRVETGCANHRSDIL